MLLPVVAARRRNSHPLRSLRKYLVDGMSSGRKKETNLLSVLKSYQILLTSGTPPRDLPEAGGNSAQ